MNFSPKRKFFRVWDKKLRKIRPKKRRITMGKALRGNWIALGGVNRVVGSGRDRAEA